MDQITPKASTIFLDIDGVLQPVTSQKRFEIDRRALQGKLANEIDPGYSKLSEYDIAAVKVDWYPDAVGHLKAICDTTGAHIVVSSSWREGKTLGELKLLFKIHGLDQHIVDMTPQLGNRALEIEAYLVAHPDIQRFVILDDQFERELGGRFPIEFVLTRGWLNNEAAAKTLAILGMDAITTPQQQSTLDQFTLLLDRSPALASLTLDIAAIGLIRRRRSYTAKEFLKVLCSAVRDAPNLQSLTVNGLRDDFSWKEPADFDPLAELKAAAGKNAALKNLGIGSGSGKRFKTPSLV